MSINVNNTRANNIIYVDQNGTKQDVYYAKDTNGNYIWAKKFDFTIKLASNIKKAKITLKKKIEPSSIGTFPTINTTKELTSQTSCEGFYGDEYEGIALDPTSPEIITFKIPDNGEIFTVSVSYFPPVFTVPEFSREEIKIQNINDYPITINIDGTSYNSDYSVIEGNTMSFTIPASSTKSFTPNIYFDLDLFDSIPSEGYIEISYSIPNKPSGSVSYPLTWDDNFLYFKINNIGTNVEHLEVTANTLTYVYGAKTVNAKGNQNVKIVSYAQSDSWFSDHSTTKTTYQLMPRGTENWATIICNPLPNAEKKPVLRAPVMQKIKVERIRQGRNYVWKYTYKITNSNNFSVTGSGSYAGTFAANESRTLSRTTQSTSITVSETFTAYGQTQSSSLKMNSSGRP